MYFSAFCRLQFFQPAKLSSNKLHYNLRGKNYDEIVTHFRWDHADLLSFYHYTRLWLQPVLNDLDMVVSEYYNGDTESVSTAIDMLIITLLMLRMPLLSFCS